MNNQQTGTPGQVRENLKEEKVTEKQLREYIAAAYVGQEDPWKITAQALAYAAMRRMDPGSKLNMKDGAFYLGCFQILRKMAVGLLARKKNPNYTAYAGK
jgi:hypothetical protein